MSLFLGIDTSNYTTSAAVYNNTDGSIVMRGRLLPVKEGEKGIRQSDAVFHHTVRLPEIIEEVMSRVSAGELSGIGVSVKPSDQEGSYMPCFLAGVSAARAASAAAGVPLFEFSHQDGHIAAALYSCNKLSLINEPFIAFHISGGTSQALLVTPEKGYFKTQVIFDSLDLKAGQAVDRVGMLLGLSFPCGARLEQIAAEKVKTLEYIKIFRNEKGFSLSGVENRCKKMLENGESPEDTAAYCLSCIYSVIYDTVTELKKRYGDLPLVFSGGVMSDRLIRDTLLESFEANFAEPAFSADNACGTAVLASIVSKGK